MSSNKERMRTYMLARYRRKRAEAIERLGGKCVDCGATEGLEFDHKDRTQKSFSIGNGWSRSAKALEDELRKCELRCRECHRRRTGLQLSVGHGEGATGKKNCLCTLCRPLKNAYSRDRRRKLRAPDGRAPSF